jgi:hypothetical protein
VSHPCGAPPFALRLNVDGKVPCYSGDTDLFIAETYFFDRVVKFRLDFETLGVHLTEIGAKRVIPTHMSANMLKRIHRAGIERDENGMIESL